jgi:hypothetical protein
MDSTGCQWGTGLDQGKESGIKNQKSDLQHEIIDGVSGMNIISLGAGVQSTTLLLMACHGEITPKPDYAIFSDTGWEPKAVYDHLEWLKKEAERFGIEVVITKKGNIKEDLMRAACEGARVATMPFFIKSKSGKMGMIHRQCTQEYKVMPVRNKIRELLGYKPRQVIKEKVKLWMGISLDEIERIKPSQVKWIENQYPLIEKGMDRISCINWLKRKGYPVPPKSSCIGCPFHDNFAWKQLKMNSPDEWQDAVSVDRIIRRLPKLKGEAYLHRSCQPLDKVYLQEDQLELDLFANECTGYCGT